MNVLQYTVLLGVADEELTRKTARIMVLF